MLSSESENQINHSEIPSLNRFIENQSVSYDPGYVLFLFESHWPEIEVEVSDAEKALLKFLVDAYGTGIFSPQN